MFKCSLVPCYPEHNLISFTVLPRFFQAWVSTVRVVLPCVMMQRHQYFDPMSRKSGDSRFVFSVFYLR